ncbi:DUF4199 domain-containing protein [Flavobacterium sp. CYK-4]|uniref:DUF4199 domain-containing protein n=1 Tax=Flavobacterium lotistagni TaxID=2709660 RepID=UPI00140D2701|nr:DUF4199 domain-containing protein [Flavobacterium lotistagni]NHM07229.1 DUF4199 domain-containing protein [Flavobacterium lotistagni]
MHTNFLRTTFPYGLFMGIGFCFYTTIMWLTHLDSTYLKTGQYLDMLIVLWPVAIIFWAIRNENQQYRVTLAQRIGIALWVGMISYLIYQPYLYAYHNFINPDWFSYVLDLKKTELEAAGEPAAKITSTLQEMTQNNHRQNVVFKLSTLVPSVLILPTLIALVSLVFIRRKVN